MECLDGYDPTTTTTTMCAAATAGGELGVADDLVAWMNFGGGGSTDSHCLRGTLQQATLKQVVRQPQRLLRPRALPWGTRVVEKLPYDDRELAEVC